MGKMIKFVKFVMERVLTQMMKIVNHVMARVEIMKN